MHGGTALAGRVACTLGLGQESHGGQTSRMARGTRVPLQRASCGGTEASSATEGAGSEAWLEPQASQTPVPQTRGETRHTVATGRHELLEESTTPWQMITTTGQLNPERALVSGRVTVA